jgi:hypothetical protein
MRSFAQPRAVGPSLASLATADVAAQGSMRPLCSVSLREDESEQLDVCDSRGFHDSATYSSASGSRMTQCLHEAGPSEGGAVSRRWMFSPSEMGEIPESLELLRRRYPRVTRSSDLCLPVAETSKRSCADNHELLVSNREHDVAPL